MPKYDIEKFEAGATERKVYWKSTKHTHNGAMITAIKQWLDANYAVPGSSWDVRANSYQSNQSSPPTDATAVEYTG